MQNNRVAATASTLFHATCQYSVNFNSGSNTQISVGHKLGSSGGGGPTVRWDTLRVE